MPIGRVNFGEAMPQYKTLIGATKAQMPELGMRKTFSDDFAKIKMFGKRLAMVDSCPKRM